MLIKRINYHALKCMVTMVTVTLVASCGRDEVDCTASCLHNALCQGSTCICLEGYEGVRCETVSRDKFIGKYIIDDGTEDCNSSSGTSVSGNVIVAADPGAVEQVVIHFNTFGNSKMYPIIHATAKDSILYFNRASLNDYEYTGSGTLTAGYLNFTISKQHQLVSSFCNIDFKMLKQ